MLFHAERNHLRWFGCLPRTSPWRFSRHHQLGRDLTRETIYHLAWEYLGLPQEELETIARPSGMPSSACCHYSPTLYKQKTMDGWNQLLVPITQCVVRIGRWDWFTLQFNEYFIFQEKIKYVLFNTKNPNKNVKIISILKHQIKKSQFYYL